MNARKVLKSSLLQKFERCFYKTRGICKAYSNTPSLEYIGNFQLQKRSSYATGQMFVHKVLAYRGVILYPWSAIVYERKKINKKGKKSKTSNQQINPKSEIYYQVLMDSRDLQNIDDIMRKEGVTFLHKMSSDRNQCLYTIPGIDYVAHSDVLPYKSAEPVPIQHDLFDQFLDTDVNSRCVTSSKMLGIWQKTHHECLQVKRVYKETTGEIKITAIPFFLGVKQTQSSQDYWWRYSIRVEYRGDNSARLRERHLQVVSDGAVKTVKGKGVTGREPLLTKDEPVFQFSSHVSLQSSTGTVWGTFRFEGENGKHFDAGIPAFPLESKSDGNL